MISQHVLEIGSEKQDTTFHARNLGKPISLCVVSKRKRVEKQTSSSRVTIKCEVSISGYGYPSSVSLSDTLTIPAKERLDLVRPYLIGPPVVSPYRATTVKIMDGSADGSSTFDRYEIVQMLPGNKEKLLYKGRSRSWSFTPSEHNEHYVRLRVIEYHRNGKSIASLPFNITISDYGYVADLYGGDPTVTAMHVDGTDKNSGALVLADFYI